MRISDSRARVTGQIPNQAAVQDDTGLPTCYLAGGLCLAPRTLRQAAERRSGERRMHPRISEDHIPGILSEPARTRTTAEDCRPDGIARKRLLLVVPPVPGRSAAKPGSRHDNVRDLASAPVAD